MTEQALPRKVQQLMVFKLLEQIKATQLLTQMQQSQQQLQDIKQQISDSQQRLTQQQQFNSAVFCPELKRLQFNAVQHLQHDLSCQLTEAEKLVQIKATQQSAYAQSKRQIEAFNNTTANIAGQLRQRQAERQDQQINALHYQRKYNKHG